MIITIMLSPACQCKHNLQKLVGKWFGWISNQRTRQQKKTVKYFNQIAAVGLIQSSLCMRSAISLLTGNDLRSSRICFHGFRCSPQALVPFLVSALLVYFLLQLRCMHDSLSLSVDCVDLVEELITSTLWQMKAMWGR